MKYGLQVLPQMMGKVLLFCLSFAVLTLDRYRQLLRLGMFLFFLVHLLCNCYPTEEKQVMLAMSRF